ncbi:hypothetical protein ACFX19_014778 [Malus domestica]
MHHLRDISLLAEAGALENLTLELERRVVEVLREAGVLHEALVRCLEVIGRAVAGVIDQVDGSGSGHDVDRQPEDEDGGADDDGDEIVLRLML